MILWFQSRGSPRVQLGLMLRLCPPVLLPPESPAEGSPLGVQSSAGSVRSERSSTVRFDVCENVRQRDSCRRARAARPGTLFK